MNSKTQPAEEKACEGSNHVEEPPSSKDAQVAFAQLQTPYDGLLQARLPRETAACDAAVRYPCVSQERLECDRQLAECETRNLNLPWMRNC